MLLQRAGDVFEGETILVAAGYYSRKLLHTAGVDVPMNKVLLEAIVTEAEPAMFEQMLGTALGRLLWSPNTPTAPLFLADIQGLRHMLVNMPRMLLPASTAISAPTAARAILNYFPRLQNAKIVRTWAGVMDECADKVPVMSWADEVPGPGNRLWLFWTRLWHFSLRRAAAKSDDTRWQCLNPAA